MGADAGAWTAVVEVRVDAEGRGEPDGGDRVGRVSAFSFPIASMSGL